MKNTMINTMIINQLNEVVDSIASRNNSGGNIPSSLSKKVGLALSVLTSDKGELYSTDFIG